MTLNLAAEALDARAIGGRLELDSRKVNHARLGPGEGAEARDRGAGRGALPGSTNCCRSTRGGSAETPKTGSAEAGVRWRHCWTAWARGRLRQLPVGAGAARHRRRRLAADGAGAFDPRPGAVDLEFTARLSEEKTAELVRAPGASRAGRPGWPAGPSRELAARCSNLPSASTWAICSPTAWSRRSEEAGGLLKGLIDGRLKSTRGRSTRDWTRFNRRARDV